MPYSFDEYTLKTGYTNAGHVPYASLEEFFALVATADTHEEAIEKLRVEYERRVEFLRDEGDEIPVPGGPKQKAKFASTEEIDKLSGLLAHFLEHVLGTSYKTSFVSDESQLCDWEHYVGDRAAVIKKTKDVYGVDITDLYDETIVDILRNIRNSGEPAWKRFFRRLGLIGD